MKNDAWSTVVNTVTAAWAGARKPIRLWLLRPIVTVVGAIATGVFVTIWSVPEFWNSTQWDE